MVVPTQNDRKTKSENWRKREYGVMWKVEDSRLMLMGFSLKLLVVIGILVWSGHERTAQTQ